MLVRRCRASWVRVFLRASGVLGLGLLALGACGGPSRGGFNPADGGGSTDTGVARDTALPGDTGRRCARQEDCDDGFPCTSDACVVGGVCEHLPDDRLCRNPGERCFPSRGCASGTTCTSDMDCDDRVECTRDLCAAGGLCQHLRNDGRCTMGQVCSVTAGCVAMGRCAMDIDCDDRAYCNGVERCVGGLCQAGTPPNCADMEPCTGDVCNEMTRSCDHPRLEMCGGSVTAGTYTLDMPPAYSCGAGSFGPVTRVTLAVTGAVVTVTGFPVPLTGSAMGAMFSASGTQSQGGCTWVYNLQGAFTRAGRFDGTWNLRFDLCDVTRMCFTRSGLLTGTSS